MRRLFTLLFCICISLSLFGCEQVTKKPEGELAYLGYYNNDDGAGYLEAITRALDDYAIKNEMKFTSYQMRTINKDTFTSTLDLAMKAGANTFVVPFDFYSILMEVHANYPDCIFVLLDCVIDEASLGDVKNIYSTSFNAYETGYLAGYMLGLEEYTEFAYASQFVSQVEERYVSGILNGLNDACSTIVTEDGKKKTYKNVNFTYYDFQNTNMEDIKTTIARAYQTKIDVFFYLGSALYEVVEDYTERSGFEYVAYCANDRNNDNDVITIHINYSALLEATLNTLKQGNAPTNMVFGMSDEVQSMSYDMDYLQLSTERVYLILSDQIENAELVLEDDPTVSWDKLKVKNIKTERVSE